MSIESEIEENKKRLELLKLARHMLNEQYLKDRASAYVQWSAESDRAWKEQGVKLPFPPTPAMPSEADIVAKALDLYNHINAPKQEVPAPPVPEPAVEPTPVTETVTEPAPIPVVEPISDIRPAAIESPSTPNITQPAITTVSTVPGPADMVVAETAIKEIFNAPASDPVLVPTELPRSESVVPLIKGMLKKGLLPSWIKPTNDTSGTI